jgi:hypothetical protein
LNSFYERPILNSPYRAPELHHPLDQNGQPSGLTPASAARIHPQRFHPLQNRSRGTQEIAVGRRSRHAAARSLENDHLDRVFELPNAAAQCGLTRSRASAARRKPPCSAADTAYRRCRRAITDLWPRRASSVFLRSSIMLRRCPHRPCRKSRPCRKTSGSFPSPHVVRRESRCRQHLPSSPRSPRRPNHPPTARSVGTKERATSTFSKLLGPQNFPRIH